MRVLILLTLLTLFFPSHLQAAETSEATGECLECHRTLGLGMVAAWEKSL